MNPHLQRSLLLYQQSRFDLAEAELHQALALDPNEAYAHGLLALCLAQRQKFNDATTEAQQAVHLAPDFPFAHYALAHVWHERGHFQEALTAIQEALRLEPDSADYHALQSQLHLDLKQWSEALAAAERGLEIDSEHVHCTNLRAVALVKLGRKSEAGATIDAALARNPDDALTHANQGWTLLEQGDYRRALEHFRESLRLDPDNEWARQGIIEALKARYFIYSIFLRYFLWMSKLEPRVQWGILLGGYIASRVLSSVGKAVPALAPFTLPVTLLYLVFVFLTWTADPLFNLLLRLNRFGRLALSDEEKSASNWVGSCVLLTVLSLAAYGLAGFTGPWGWASLVFGILIIPLAGTFKTASGWPRRMMSIYTLIMAAAGLGILTVRLLTNGRELPSTDPLESLFSTCLGVFLIGAIGSSWVANWLMQQRPKR